jgi:hypothetical protein
MDRVPTALAATARPRWQELVEAAVLDRESDNLPQRIRDARSAVMDEIEYSFHTADACERPSLINAMNASGPPSSPLSRAARRLQILVTPAFHRPSQPCDSPVLALASVFQ